MVKERIQKLRELMKARNLTAFLVTTSDPHQSEYLPDYYKTRGFITGFTGSAGSFLLTMDKAILWTDSRYFIQAAYELQGSGIELYKQGIEGVPTLMEVLKDLPNGSKIGFDGKCISYSLYRSMLNDLDGKVLHTDCDLISKLWEDRPILPQDKISLHDEIYTGENAKLRIEKLRDHMSQIGADYTFIGALDEIAYLFQIRGNDITCNPVALSYALVSMDSATLFINEDKLDENARAYFMKNGVTIKPYESVFEEMAGLEARKALVFDPNSVNVAIIAKVPSNVSLIKEQSFVMKMKAVKNETELYHQRKAYIKDGVALVKFFNWVETGVPTGTVSEQLAVEKLLQFRKQGEGFIESSFETIAAYGPNAAMPHYDPMKNPETVMLKDEGLFLVDSGGQYLDGTTDITRTVALGKLTEDEIYHYTMTLKAHIGMASCHFKKGTPGYYIDAFCRYNLLKNDLDFGHGTGHGVGYYLNVHEGPHRVAGAVTDSSLTPLEIGMVMSNEPGLYIAGKHGIRIENIVVVQPAAKNEFGEFHKFETLSIVPIDTRPVDVKLLSDDELTWLNAYNKECYDKLSPYLEGTDLKYLKKLTQKLER